MGLRARRRTVVVWRSSRGPDSSGRYGLTALPRPPSTWRLRRLLHIGGLLAAIAVIRLGRALRLVARLAGGALIVTGVVLRGDVGALAFITGFVFIYASLVIHVRPPADRERRLALERELADYSAPAGRRDLEAILDRYSDGDTSEMRDILIRQTVATQGTGVPGIGRPPVNPR